MKTKKSFWKVNLFSLFLVLVLLVLVGLNLDNSWRVQVDLVDEINTLECELGLVKHENAVLKAEKKSLAQEALSWLTKCQEYKHFLGDQQGEIDTLVKLSEVVNCCYVPPREAQAIALEIVKMGHRLKCFQQEIKRFLGGR